MSAIELQVSSHQTHNGLPCQLLHIKIVNENGVVVPGDLKDVKFPEGIDFKKGVILEGKAPIWLYGYLVHQCCHFAPWLGCYDPCLGVVIVATRTPGVEISEVLKVDLPAS
jgi:CRISPR-associated protein Csx3